MTKRMDWKELICSQRSEGPKDPISAGRSPFQRDFDRIVFTSAFRRLQDKTQVVPLAGSDFIRTRLTHSLESTCMGRSLGNIVGEHVCSEIKESDFSPQDFGAIVAAACLAHDIGNPPFGHSGEDAIQLFFKENAEQYLKGLSEAKKQDLFNFEGNAQGFRVLTRIQRSYETGGLRLTYGTLGAFTKYPQESTAVGKTHHKKHGFFQADKKYFDDIAKKLGLIRSGEFASYARHPLAYLVEAADDISFKIADFEDGFRRKLVDFEKADKMLVDVIKQHDRTNEKLAKNNANNDSNEDRERHIGTLRALAIGATTELAGDEFIKHHNQILAGEYQGSLIDNSPAKKTIDAIYSYSKENIYTARPIVEIESAGFEVLGGLLEAFLPCVLNGTLNKKEKKLQELIPPQMLKNANSNYEKILGITDFVSGMTDHFAISLYRKIKGISLPEG